MTQSSAVREPELAVNHIYLLKKNKIIYSNNFKSFQCFYST